MSVLEKVAALFSRLLGDANFSELVGSCETEPCMEVLIDPSILATKYGGSFCTFWKWWQRLLMGY